MVSGGRQRDRAHAKRSAELRAADAELVRRALEGEADAFAELFERHRDGLYRLAWHYTRDEERAMDLVQDTFLRAHQALDRFRHEASFSTWLRRIATNLAIDRERSKKGEEVELDEIAHAEPLAAQPGRAPAEGPVEAAELAELRRDLAHAVGSLSVPHRAVFVLHAVEGLSYREIAETVGCELGTVMSRLHYARQRLREKLKGHLTEGAAG